MDANKAPILLMKPMPIIMAAPVWVTRREATPVMLMAPTFSAQAQEGSTRSIATQ